MDDLLLRRFTHKTNAGEASSRVILVLTNGAIVRGSTMSLAEYHEWVMNTMGVDKGFADETVGTQAQIPFIHVRATVRVAENVAAGNLKTTNWRIAIDDIVTYVFTGAAEE